MNAEKLGLNLIRVFRVIRDFVLADAGLVS